MLEHLQIAIKSNRKNNPEKQEVDDVAGKTRRNLVVFAATIIAIWALDIPLSGNLLGAIALDKVHPTAAWIAAILILAYLFSRFYHEPHVNRERKRLRQERDDDFLSMMSAEYTSAALAISQEYSTKNVRASFDSPRPHAEAVPVVYMPDVKNTTRKVHFFFTWAEKSEDYPRSNRNATIIQRDRQGYWTLRVCRYWHIRLQVWLRAHKFGFDLFEYAVPIGVSALALVVAVCKLLASLYYSFPFVRQLLSA